MQELYTIFILIIAHEPSFLGHIEKIHGAQDIGRDKNIRVCDTSVHMTLSCKVNNIGNLVLIKQCLQGFLIANIGLYKGIVWIALDADQVFKISGIGQLVKIDDLDILVLLQHVKNEVGPDKTGSARDEISFHCMAPLLLK